MAAGVDRKRILHFLDSIQEAVNGPTASTSGVMIKGGGGRRSHHLFGSYQIPTEQLRAIYKEVFIRARGRLIHRFERRIGELSSLCYQNAYAPRVAFVFFHGLDGTPYDYIYTVRRFFERMGNRLPALWVLPAGSHRSRPSSSLYEDQRDYHPELPHSPPRASTPSAEVLDPSPTEAARTYVMSPFGPNPSVRYGDVEKALRKRVDELVEPEMSCDDIDPSGGYQWWEIPAINLFTGRSKGFKMFVHALKQNWRTPKEFFAVREQALTTIQSVSSVWDIPLSQIYIGGFSQGAMLASDLVLAAPSPLGGAVLLSGAPIGRTDHKQAMREHRMMHSSNPNVAVMSASPGSPAKLSIEAFTTAKQQMPIFQAHGMRDPVIPFPIGKFLRKHLYSMGLTNITFESFSGGHDFPPDIADKVLAWLLTTPTVRALAHRRPDPSGDHQEGGSTSEDPSCSKGGSVPSALAQSAIFEDGVLPSTSLPEAKLQGRFSTLKSKFSSLSRRRRTTQPQRVAITTCSSMDDDWSIGGCDGLTEFVDLSPVGSSLMGGSGTSGSPMGAGSSPMYYPTFANCGRMSMASSSMDLEEICDEDDETFDWAPYNVSMSRLIAETFLTVKCTTSRVLMLPPGPVEDDLAPPPESSSSAKGRKASRRMTRLEIPEGSDWLEINRKITRELSITSDSGRGECLTTGSRSFCLPATLRGDFDFPLKEKKAGGGTTMNCPTPSTLAPQESSPYSDLAASIPVNFTSPLISEDSGEDSSSSESSPQQPMETLESWCTGELSETERPEGCKYVPRNALPKGQRAREAKEKLRHPRTWRRAKKSMSSSAGGSPNNRG